MDPFCKIVLTLYTFVAMLLCSGPVMANRSLGAAGAAAGLLASRQQQLHRGSTLGKHGRDSSGLAADSASKRFKRGGLTRPGPVGAVGRPAAIADKHLAVGCRVAVYWRLDKVFYRVSGFRRGVGGAVDGR